MSARFINCEFCQTEGRILTNDGGPDDVDNGICPECNGECVVEVETQPITMEDFHPDNNLPGCMMPDGGDCCAGHAAVVEDWHKQRREIELLRGLLKEVTKRGLIYWEPQTTRGAMAKADMIARLEAVIAEPNTIKSA